jgi:hypothetical protein
MTSVCSGEARSECFSPESLEIRTIVETDGLNEG